MIETQIIALLRADPDVTALAADRITPGYLVHEGALPAIAVRRASGGSAFTFGGVAGRSASLLIVCWAPGWAAARTLAEAARRCLSAYTGGAIDIINITDGEDMPVPETGEYGCTLVATVEYQEV